MSKLTFGEIACLVALFCVATVVASEAQTFDALLSFDVTNGAYPDLGSLIQGTDGNLYGTTSGGEGTDSQCPLYDCGTVFKMTPTGQLSTLYKFCSKTNCTDGRAPAAGLALGTNGNFYGTTQYGGASGAGTVFEITSSGILTTLHSFCAEAGKCPDGTGPLGRLIQAANGSFYGTTSGGGGYTSGTVFEITQAGKLTTLHNFCASGYPCSDGEIPYAGLAQGADGNFYGTTTFGGPSQYGTLFRITPAGRFTTLYSFCSEERCSDGAYPYGDLMLGTDGNFYGTTSGGGLASWGTVFEITPADTLSTLYNFGPCSTGCPDGAVPMAGLVQGSDGNFYGTTQMGGFIATLCGGIINVGCGVAFQLTPAGEITILHDFCSQSGCSDGFSPEGEPFEATNGIFYGTTTSGGNTTGNCYPYGCGTLYSVSVGLGPFVEANPNFGKAGRIVGILGNNLTETTSVTFNGTPATFEVVSATYLKATVPIGATTGTIQVTTPSGTLSSNVAFRILP